jgi:hypothetical protein
MPCWAVVAAGRGAEPSVERSAAGRCCAQIYAVGVISLGWWPWNVLLLALLFKHQKDKIISC